MFVRKSNFLIMLTVLAMFYDVGASKKLRFLTPHRRVLQDDAATLESYQNDNNAYNMQNDNTLLDSVDDELINGGAVESRLNNIQSRMNSNRAYDEQPLVVRQIDTNGQSRYVPVGARLSTNSLSNSAVETYLDGQRSNNPMHGVQSDYASGLNGNSFDEKPLHNRRTILSGPLKIISAILAKMLKSLETIKDLVLGFSKKSEH